MRIVQRAAWDRRKINPKGEIFVIYTVTLNPALDYVVWLDELQPGKLNRTSQGQTYPGGKGVNVSIVLHTLGVPTQAMGFAGGTAGKALCEALNGMGVPSAFLQLKNGETRINVKLQAQEETEVNGIGPILGEEDLQALIKKLEVLRPGDILVLAGSLPQGLAADTYARLAEAAAQRGARAVVDTCGDVLKQALAAKPFLIKPNRAELSGLLRRAMGTVEQVERAAREVQAMGAQNVLVSLDKGGAALLLADGTFVCQPAPKGNAVNTVGAGDAMVAGFLAALEQDDDLRKALDWGLAAGTAAACVPWMPTREQIEAMLPAER